MGMVVVAVFSQGVVGSFGGELLGDAALDPVDPLLEVLELLHVLLRVLHGVNGHIVGKSLIDYRLLLHRHAGGKLSVFASLGLGLLGEVGLLDDGQGH